MKYTLAWSLALLIAGISLAQGNATTPTTITPTTKPIAGGYAIVVAQSTIDDPAWGAAIKKLQDHYPGATVITWRKSVVEAQKELAALLPKYTCFVGKPTEVGRVFCADVHRMTRKLNDDPYIDTIWGIITGYTPEDAMRLASLTQPLVLRRGVGLGMNIGPFEEAVDFSDGKAGLTTYKKHDGTTEQKEAGDADRATAFAKAVKDIRPDFMGSDGHATERDLQMPFGKGGLFCRKGTIMAVDYTTRVGSPINSPNPKVYLAYGNCLIGHIDGKDAIALAFIHSLGVNQFVGYTVATWYGKGGWGVNDWLFGQQGRWNLSESHFINQQFLLHELRRCFPKHADFLINPTQYKRNDITGIARAIRSKNEDELGMLWDRDTVVLWGDPAWDARFPAPKSSPWQQTLKRENDRYTLTIMPNVDGEIGKVFAFLPNAVNAPKIIQGNSLKPVIGAWFVMVPSVGKVKKDSPVTIQFTAQEITPVSR